MTETKRHSSAPLTGESLLVHVYLIGQEPSRHPGLVADSVLLSDTVSALDHA
ncbi:hypothetical protein [Paenibacillus sp. FSL R7-0179]|uniref:hypothetical protein n=1 Tax=Paenibacillus sp. FSL R7-0179 TaxID=2921672 RepID=UPI0030F9BF22